MGNALATIGALLLVAGGALLAWRSIEVGLKHIRESQEDQKRAWRLQVEEEKKKRRDR